MRMSKEDNKLLQRIDAADRKRKAAMLNAIEAYAECGRRAGQARNVGDESRARFETEHMSRMLELEKLADKNTARDAFCDAYKKAREQYLFSAAR